MSTRACTMLITGRFACGEMTCCDTIISIDTSALAHGDCSTCKFISSPSKSALYGLAQHLYSQNALFGWDEPLFFNGEEEGGLEEGVAQIQTKGIPLHQLDAMSHHPHLVQRWLWTGREKKQEKRGERARCVCGGTTTAKPQHKRVGARRLNTTMSSSLR